MALSAMAEENCSTVEMITAAAGHTAGQEATIAIQDEFADNEFFCFVAEEGSVEQPEFGSRSPVGLHVSDVEAAPTSIDDMRKSEFREVWSSAMQAELGGHEEAGTFSVTYRKRRTLSQQSGFSLGRQTRTVSSRKQKLGW